MTDQQREALGEVLRLTAGFVCNEDGAGMSPAGIGEAALAYARACGWLEPSSAVAVTKARDDLGRLLGIPSSVHTWRRIRDELVTLRQALHIEGDQTATEAAYTLENVAEHIIDVFIIESPPDYGAPWECQWCGAHARATSLEAAAREIEHQGDCVLALAWRALGKPGPVGSTLP